MVKNSQLTDNLRTFSYTRLTCPDVTFSNNNLHVVLRLKRRKSDTEHLGVDIVLAVTGSITCPVEALQTLFRCQPLCGDQPLFGFNEEPLHSDWMIATLRKRAELLHGPASFPAWSKILRFCIDTRNRLN